jgi:hypothetical protein
VTTPVSLLPNHQERMMDTRMILVGTALAFGLALSDASSSTRWGVASAPPNDNYTILASSTADFDIELNLTNSVCRVDGGAWVEPLPGAQRLLVPARAVQVGGDIEFPPNSPRFTECRVGARRAGNPNGTWNRNIVRTMSAYRSPPTGMVQMGDVRLRI